MRKSTSYGACLAVGMALLGAVACAPAFGQQKYPSRAIRLVLPFPPGGSTDIVARLIGQKITESWGQQVIVDNRPGGGGNVAAEAVARAAPDGYTLFQVNVANAIGATLYPRLNYSLVGDFAPVTQLATTPYVLLAHPSVPAKSMRELVALAKARPGQLNYASAGAGSATHLSGELLKSLAAVNIVHVPYRGTGPAVTALLSGEIVRILGLPDVREQLKGQGLDPVGGTTEQFGAYIKVEIAKWGKVVAASGARPE